MRARVCHVCAQVQASGVGIVWERTQAWVTAAAQLAPATTEALLHSFICSTAVVGSQTDAFLHTLSRSMSVGTAGGFSRSESPLPNGNLSALANGHAAASYQLQQRQHQAAAGALASPDSALFPNRSSREGFHASQAAFRRAADLLQICGAARTKQQAAGADGAYEGTLAFARKLHYSGAVAGLMQGSAEEEDVMGSDTTAGAARRQQVGEQVCVREAGDTNHNCVWERWTLCSKGIGMPGSVFTGRTCGFRAGCRPSAGPPCQLGCWATTIIAILCAV